MVAAMRMLVMFMCTVFIMVFTVGMRILLMVVMLLPVRMIMPAAFVAMLMGMFMLIVFMVLMGMMFVIALLMTVSVMMLLPVFILLMRMGRALVDAEFYPLYALALLALEVHVEIADFKLGKLPLKGGRFYPEIGERTHRHVAADAGDAIEKKDFHSDVFDLRNPCTLSQKTQSSTHGCREPGFSPLLKPMPWIPCS